MANETDIYAEAFFMADHAAVENGKVYTSGAFWNRLNFPGFPAVTHFGIVVVLNIPWRAYHQNHKFVIRFEDADAKPLPAELGGEFTVGTSPDMKVGDPTIMPIAAMVNNFVLDHAGDYSAVVTVDGTEIARWPFRAGQIVGTSNFQPMMPGDPGLA